MPTFSRLCRFTLLIFAALILTQCSEKKIEDFVEQGHAYTRQQKYDKAVEAYLRAIEKRPSNPEAYYGLGGIYNYKEMYRDAEQAFLVAIQHDPTHFNAYFSLGFTYEKMGRNEDAEKQFERYRELKAKFDNIRNEDKKEK